MTTLQVNGRAQQLDVDPSTPVLWALRDSLGLTGTKFGCGAALCGACTVHVDGQADMAGRHGQPRLARTETGVRLAGRPRHGGAATITAFKLWPHRNAVGVL